MLREITIRNFAIIDDLTIRFRKGLTILSGETGAGKSIIIQAVNLLLGSRASARMIRSGCDLAELEAIFELGPDSPVAATMTAQGYLSDEGLLIRRIISKNDRHRIYINGRLATVTILNGLVEHLASISGQHAHQVLLKSERHLDILDQYGRLMLLRSELKTAFDTLQPMIAELDRLAAIRDGRSEHFRLLSFQRDEIIKSEVTPGEDEQLEIDRNRLKNTEILRQAVLKCVDLLYAMDGAVVERLAQGEHCLEKARRIDSYLDEPANRITETRMLVEDLVESLRSYGANLSVDEAALEKVEERIDTLVKLKHKYGGSLEAILEYLNSAEKELAKVENINTTIAALEEKIKKQYRSLVGLCRSLSKKRAKAADQLARKVESQLGSLRMDNTSFQVDLSPQTASSKTPIYLKDGNRQITENGFDVAIFMIAPNVGEKLKPLAEIASGGELSRLVLALKVIIAEGDAVETVVFDEVDAGIGGGTAETVGRKLADLAQSHQVICITHLPQIARFGAYHIRIEKSVIDGRTVTGMTPIGPKERINELARMLGGEKITPKTIEHAQELLKSG